MKHFFLSTLLHSERPKLHTILAFLSAIGLNFVDMNFVFLHLLLQMVPKLAIIASTATVDHLKLEQKKIIIFLSVRSFRN